MRAALVLLLLLAGCVAPAATEGGDDALAGIEPHFPQEHDHGDPSLHAHADGLAALGGHTLAADGGARGDWLTSEIVVRGTRGFVAYLGAPWLLAVLDLSDARAPELLGQLPTTNAWGMDVAADEGGEWAFVGVYPSAVGEIFAPGYALSHLGAPAGINAPGVAVVDVRDPSAPRLSSFLPTSGLGPHTLVHHAHANGHEYVFANKADAQIGNAVLISELVTLPTGDRALRPVAQWMLDGPVDQDQPHDVDVQQHPLTGQTLMYVANTWAGVTIVDVTDPAAPTTISTLAVGDASDPDALMHDVHPYPTLVDGRHYTLAAPEIITGDTTGTLRVLDTTDPTAPTEVGTWRMPGEIVLGSDFDFSTHNFVYLPDGRVALAHGHGGVWIVDWLTDKSAPRAVAYYAHAFPDARTPAWSPVSGSPWFWGTAVDANGVLWASDTMGGVMSLVETGTPE